MPYKDLERRRERAKERRAEDPSVHRKGDAKYKRTLKGQYGSLKARAKKRDIEVTLTYDEFVSVRSSGKCTYCDRDLPTDSIGHCIDRKDNATGYTVENSVPCCGDCNKVKSDVLTHEEMIVAMKAVMQHRVDHQPWAPVDEWYP